MENFTRKRKPITEEQIKSVIDYYAEFKRCKDNNDIIDSVALGKLYGLHGANTFLHKIGAITVTGLGKATRYEFHIDKLEPQHARLFFKAQYVYFKNRDTVKKLKEVGEGRLDEIKIEKDMPKPNKAEIRKEKADNLLSKLRDEMPIPKREKEYNEVSVFRLFGIVIWKRVVTIKETV